MATIPEIGPIPGTDCDEEDSFVVLETLSSSDYLLSASLTEGEPLINSEIIQQVQNHITNEIGHINQQQISLTNGISPQHPSHESSYEDIQKQVEELIKENEKLKEIMTQNNASMKVQCDRILAWKEEVNNVWINYKEKFLEAKKCIDSYKEQNMKLANDAEKYKKIKDLQDEEIMHLKRKLEEMETNPIMSMNSFTNDFTINELKKELSEANLKIIEISKQNADLAEQLHLTMTQHDNEIQMKNEEIHKLKVDNEIKSELEKANAKYNNDFIVVQNEKTILEQELKEKDNAILNYEKRINELQQKNKQMEFSYLDEITTLKQNIQPLPSVANLQQELSQSRQQLMNAQMRITVLEQEVTDKNRELIEITQQQDIMKDDMFALNEQMSQYKADFESILEQNKLLKDEKDQIAEDLQNLQRRNEQLLGRVDEDVVNGRYTCPKCEFGFKTYRSLQNHVHRCLDLEHF